MTLPTSRDKTFVSGDDVPSASLNNIQDSIVGGLHGSLVYYLGYLEFRWFASYGWSIGDPTAGENRLENSTNAIEDTYAPLRLPVGTVVDALTVYFENAGSTRTPSFFLRYTEKDDDAQFSVDDDSAAAASGKQTLKITGPHTIEAGRFYMVRFSIGGGSSDLVQLFSVKVEYHRP